jgi:hypothetical protein
MYVIRLPDGNLRVPVGVVGPERESASRNNAGRNVIGQGYVEIGPDDPDYQRLLALSITPEEMAVKRRRWRADDEALRREFEEFKAEQAED